MIKALYVDHDLLSIFVNVHPGDSKMEAAARERKTKLEEEFEKPYFKNLVSFVKEEYQQNTIYPPGSQIFNAFEKNDAKTARGKCIKFKC